MPAPKVTVIVEKYGGEGCSTYKVVRVKNALDPSVGTDLNAAQIEHLISCGVEVVVDLPRARDGRR